MSEFTAAANIDFQPAEGSIESIRSEFERELGDVPVQTRTMAPDGGRTGGGTALGQRAGILDASRQQLDIAETRLDLDEERNELLIELLETTERDAMSGDGGGSGLTNLLLARSLFAGGAGGLAGGAALGGLGLGLAALAGGGAAAAANQDFLTDPSTTDEDAINFAAGQTGAGRAFGVGLDPEMTGFPSSPEARRRFRERTTGMSRQRDPLQQDRFGQFTFGGGGTTIDVTADVSIQAAQNEERQRRIAERVANQATQEMADRIRAEIANDPSPETTIGGGFTQEEARQQGFDVG